MLYRSSRGDIKHTFMKRSYLALCLLSVSVLASCAGDFDGSGIEGRWELTEASVPDENGKWTEASSDLVARPQYWTFDGETFTVSHSDTIPAAAVATPYTIVDSTMTFQVMSINTSRITRLNKKSLSLTTEGVTNPDGRSFEPLRVSFRRVE